jgi:hypothetical protein
MLLLIMMKNEIPASLTTALKIIALCLRHSDPLSYGAYRLRRTRYNLLHNNGIKSHNTYPRIDKDAIVGKFYTPVQLRHISRVEGRGSNVQAGNIYLAGRNLRMLSAAA